MIEIKHVTKEFIQGKQRVRALKDVTITLQNEMTAIIGTSGAGKSTLLHILMGIEPCEKGNVEIDNISIFDLTEKELSRFRNEYIGIVMQHYSLISDFSVLENVYLPLSFSKVRYSKKEKIAKAKKAIDLIGIDYLTKRCVEDLSAGEMQRVAIARASVGSTHYIFADEPTGALDNENTEKILSVLQQINKTGVGVIVVTHDMDVANQCKRIIRLEDGAIVDDRLSQTL